MKLQEILNNIPDKKSKENGAKGTTSYKFKEDLDSFFNRYNNNDRINFIHTQLTGKPQDANLKAIPFLKNKIKVCW